MSSIIVRTYRSEDFDACRDLFRLVHDDYQNPDVFISMTLRTDMSDIEKNYLNVPNGHFWVAVSSDDDRRILGQVAVLPLGFVDRKYYHEVPEDRRDQICELRRMAVHPSAQRQGVGKKIVETLIEFAKNKGFKQIHLTTARNMTKAWHFYDKFGFRRDKLERITIGNLKFESESDIEEFFKHLSDAKVFHSDADIPDEDRQRMNGQPEETGFIYVQHHLLDLV